MTPLALAQHLSDIAYVVCLARDPKPVQIGATLKGPGLID